MEANSATNSRSVLRGEAATLIPTESDQPSRRFSLLSEGLIGSPILKIAGEVRGLIAQGANICNLTVGDFAPSEFPVPELLSRELATAVQRGETNYPPSAGMPGLRKAV